MTVYLKLEVKARLWSLWLLIRNGRAKLPSNPQRYKVKLAEVLRVDMKGARNLEAKALERKELTNKESSNGNASGAKGEVQ